MGVYSTNRGILGAIGDESIVANESYVGETGAIQIMIENTQNEQAIFEAVIGNDFEEAYKAKNETALQESEIIAMQEASIGGMVDSIKAFLTKCWEKIKGIFKSIITKISSVIMRDNKAFVDKYKATVLKKDLSKMKYKYSEPTSASVGASIKSVDEIATTTSAAVNKVNSGSADGISEKINSGDYLEELLGCPVGEFAKTFHEKMFEDSDEKEGLSSSEISDIISILTNSKDTIAVLTKLQASYNKLFTARFKQVDRFSKDAVKAVPGKGQSESEKNVSVSAVKELNVTHKVISVEQVAANKVLGASITEVKFLISQARRIFAQAAAYNAKAVKENAIFVEAAGDAAAYDIESTFEDYSM